MPDPFGLIQRHNTRRFLTGAPRWANHSTYTQGFEDGNYVRRPRCESADYLRGYRVGRMIAAGGEPFTSIFDNDLGDIDDDHYRSGALRGTGAAEPPSLFDDPRIDALDDEIRRVAEAAIDRLVRVLDRGAERSLPSGDARP